MAILRAFRASDLRDSVLDDPIVLDADRSEIRVTDGDMTASFTGLFRLPFAGVVTPVVGAAVPLFGASLFDDAFAFRAPAPVALAGTTGTLRGYELREDGLRTFAVSDLSLDARLAFAAFDRDDASLFNKLLFAGRDTMFGSAFDDRLWGYSGGDTIWGFDGDDRLNGGGGQDLLYGVDGADRLTGGKGLDRLRGGDGDDRLFGGKHDDTLWGEDDDDLLVGGLGADLLFGGDGADVFRFNSIKDSEPGSDDRDRIRDFDPGEDLVNLIRIDANETQRGNQAFDFIGDAAFTGVAGQLRYAGGRLEGDVTGDGKADFEVAFSDSPDLGAADLLL